MSADRHAHPANDLRLTAPRRPASVASSSSSYLTAGNSSEVFERMFARKNKKQKQRQKKEHGDDGEATQQPQPNEHPDNTRVDVTAGSTVPLPLPLPPPRDAESDHGLVRRRERGNPHRAEQATTTQWPDSHPGHEQEHRQPQHRPLIQPGQQKMEHAHDRHHAHHAQQPCPPRPHPPSLSQPQPPQPLWRTLSTPLLAILDSIFASTSTMHSTLADATNTAKARLTTVDLAAVADSLRG